MNYLSNLTLIAVFIAAMSFVSCSEKSEVDNDDVIEYLPFQMTQDGKWGMISPDGEILFTEKFENEPTVARNGRFFVKNEEGLWEMYTATATPQKVGSSYVNAYSFQNMRTLVAEKNEPVSIIDTDGNQIKILDEIEGKVVDYVERFQEKYAVFMTVDSLFGAIDIDGNCVVKPEYDYLRSCCDGKFIGINAKYKNKAREEAKISVIDTKGEVLFELGAGSPYKYNGFDFSNGLLCVIIEKEGKRIFGFINDKGDLVTELPSVKYVMCIYDDKFVYNDGENVFGLMNTKGEKIITEFGCDGACSFDYAGQGIFKVQVAEIVDNRVEGWKYTYISENGKQISSDTYKFVSSFFNGKYAIVKPNQSQAYIIDKSGNKVDEFPELFDISLSEGDYAVESDWVDLQGLIDAFDISDEGIFGITLNTQPKDAVKIVSDLGLIDKKAGIEPDLYKSKTKLILEKTVFGITGKICIDYATNMGKQWDKCTPNSIRIRIPNEHRMHGKLHKLYQSLCQKIKSTGAVIVEDTNGAIISINDGEDQVLLGIYCNLIEIVWANNGQFKDVDVSTFDGMDSYDESLAVYDPIYEEDNNELECEIDYEADNAFFDNVYGTGNK